MPHTKQPEDGPHIDKDIISFPTKWFPWIVAGFLVVPIPVSLATKLIPEKGSERRASEAIQNTADNANLLYRLDKLSDLVSNLTVQMKDQNEVIKTQNEHFIQYIMSEKERK